MSVSSSIRIDRPIEQVFASVITVVTGWVPLSNRPLQVGTQYRSGKNPNLIFTVTEYNPTHRFAWSFKDKSGNEFGSRSTLTPIGTGTLVTEEDITNLVPNLGAFVTNKLLSSKKRRQIDQHLALLKQQTELR